MSATTATTATPASSERRTQGERTAHTRGLILDATVDSLIEDGYAATSTTAVQRRAGVSRGALMHHFPSKQDLLLDAVTHLTLQRGEWLAAQVDRLPPGADRQAAGIALLWRTMTGPLFAAATELWIAARTDKNLQTALVISERRLGASARDFLADVLGAEDPDDPAFRQAFDYVLQVFRGASLTAILRDDARWERRTIALATDSFRRLYHSSPQSDPTITTTPRGDPR